MASSPDFSASKEANIENVENGSTPIESARAHQGQIDPEMRKRIVRKLDKRIIPCLMFMYLANYVDRSNVAAARVKGLQRDLGLDDLQYANVISLFFVTYVGLQVPITFGVAYVKKPTYFICGCMVVWGAISTAAGAVQNYAGILAVRLTLGIAEAAFFPVALFTLSKFYTREEMGFRATAYYAAALLAGAFGSILAAGIIDGTNGKNGIAGWRYLFYIEGAITIAGGVIIAFILPNFPGTASFLTEEERYWAVRRLVDDSGRVDEDAEGDKWYAPLAQAFKEPVLYLLALCIWTLTAGVSFNQYSPTLTASLGFGSTQALLLTAPPYFYAMLLSLANSWHSDKQKERSWHIIGPMIPACVGVIIPLATTSVAARYVGIFLMTGAYASYTVLLSWLPACFPSHPKRRAVAVAFLAAFSNTANIAGGYFFRADRFGPSYRGSFAIILSMFAACAVMAYVVRLYLIRKNKQLDAAEALLAQAQSGVDDALVEKTARTQGMTLEEAATLKASYRFYI